MNAYLKIFFRYFWYWPQIIYFNIKYLPISQAVRMPILLYKPHLLKCGGSISIRADKIWFGMIQLGNFRCRLYPNGGFTWVNEGGECVFEGKCTIGNNAALYIRKNGYVEFGRNFLSTEGLKLTSAKKIVFGEDMLIGWDVIITDTSFHRLKKSNGEERDGNPDRNKEIVIGRNNWIAMKCIVMKGSKTPDHVVLGAGSVLNKDYSDLPSYSLLAGSPLTVKSTGIWRDPDDHLIDNEF